MTETLSEVFDRAAQLYGDREAVVGAATRWSYREFHFRTVQFDNALDRLGLHTGDVVAVLARNSPEHLLCWMAIPRSGRILNDLNTRLAVGELQLILSDSGARVLIVDDAFLALGRTLAAMCATIEHLVHAGDAPADDLLSFDDLCTGSSAGIRREVDPDAVGGIFYTGGTTGVPKGAMLTHRNLIQNAKHMLICLNYSDADTYLHSAPMFHLADGASTYAVTWVGGRHVIQPNFEPAEWMRLVARERVTRSLLVPTMINMVVNHLEVGTHDLSSLGTLPYGASPMPTELLRIAMTRIPSQWVQIYGMTEAAPLLTLLTAADHLNGLSGDERGSRRLRSAGRPIVGVEVEVRRADGHSLCEANEPGEIYARGSNIMKGYLNRPEETPPH